MIGDLVKHEMGHVTIANKHKPLIKEAVSGIVGTGTACDEKAAWNLAEADYKKKIDKAFYDAVAKHDTEQHQYDADTNHGAPETKEQKKKQKKWYEDFKKWEK